MVSSGDKKFGEFKDLYWYDGDKILPPIDES